MARKIRDARLESRSARLRLPVREKPYTGPTIARGIHLLFRRNKHGGRWVCKASDGHGQYWTRAFATADDFEDADGERVLNFHQACDQARLLARGKSDTPDSKPLTVADALVVYRNDLKSRGGALSNVTRVEYHLTGALKAKPVGLLTARDLKQWRDSMIGKMEPSSIRRTCVGLRAALELAATLDPRITNREAFRQGLRGLPDSNKARRMVLPDEDVLRLIRASYEVDAALGLLVEVLAATGARISQAARLLCSDLQTDAPRLMVPRSYKGRGQKAITHRPVPVTSALAVKLAIARDGRRDDERLLLKSDRQAWQATSTCDHRDLFAHAVKLAGLDPALTSYCLRHSAIVRSLLRGVPTAVVAQQCDTSVREIEKHYGAYLTDFSDAQARRGLLDTAAPTGNVVALKR
jgi:integrase